MSIASIMLIVLGAAIAAAAMMGAVDHPWNRPGSSFKEKLKNGLYMWAMLCFLIFGVLGIRKLLG